MGAGVTAALGISACATPATTFENASSSVELFLRDAREFQPALYQYTDDELIEVARLSCGALDEGVPLEDLIGMLVDAFVGSDLAAMEGIAYVIGGGIVLFCPHHEYQLDRL